MSSLLSSIPPEPSSTAPASSLNATTQQTATSNPLGNESTFLTLLVSQLQNQDPLNPTDSNQFVSQLTAFSQLEQLMAINQNTAQSQSMTPQSQTLSGSPAPNSGKAGSISPTEQ